MRPSRSHIPALDGLRGLAALFVLFGHFPAIEHFTVLRRAFTWFDSAALGVDVFFALSGFLITRIILADKAADAFGLRTFYLRRALRIMPIYYLTILVVGFLITWEHAGWSALYLGNFTFAFDPAQHPLRHVWSLAVEEHFYLVWPLVLAKVSVRTARRLAFPVLPGLAIGLPGITCQLMPAADVDALIIRGSMYRMLSICLGAWVAFEEERSRRLSLPIVIGMAVLALLLPHFTIHSLEQRWGSLFVSNYTIKLMVLACASLCWLLVALNLDQLAARYPVMGIPRAMLVHPVLRSIGLISYGLYLYHYPILFRTGSMEEVLLGPGRAVMELALVFTVPVLSWFLIERPLLAFKDRIGRATG